MNPVTILYREKKKMNPLAEKSVSIKITGTESLGVRGMCCLIETPDRKVLIDPGIALGYERHGLLPHPLQIAEGIKVRCKIIEEMRIATDIVFSHFHGDHVPLLRANPYQLSFSQVPALRPNLRIWAKSEEGLSPVMKRRADELSELFGPAMRMAEGCQEGPISFSDPVPHGPPASRFGTVIMTRIDTGEGVFVHASDIQLLDADTVEKILSWEPDIVFAAGPPLYLEVLDETMRKQAWENGMRLARHVDTLILDHHLLRSSHGVVWLGEMSRKVGRRIYCAADFMRRPRLLLEAERQALYDSFAVPENWHQDYVRGRISLSEYVNFKVPFISPSLHK